MEKGRFVTVTEVLSYIKPLVNSYDVIEIFKEHGKVCANTPCTAAQIWNSFSEEELRGLITMAKLGNL